ncbi:MAG: flagellar associated protein [Monoraphidium minutum]|nr:MAG: flagellar associated protein [Monoraphidium minutum]
MAQVSKKFNPVERDQILTELIRREERMARPSEVFSVPDPRRMTLLPAKPNAAAPADRPTAAQLAAAEATLATLAGIKHAHQVPTQVYQLPVTSNMEYGFHAAAVPQLKDDPMFVHYANQSDVTLYASSYVQLTGRSPFKRSGGGATTAAK